MLELSSEFTAKRRKYQDAEEELRRLIRSLGVGAKLPSERVLAKTFHCNFLTIRRAMAPLVAEGAISRRIGSGTFVTAVSSRTLSGDRLRIGVLLLQNDDPYAYHVLQSLATAASEAGVELSSTWASDFSTDGLDRVKTLATEGCRVCILLWVPPERVAQVRAFVDACPVPVCLPLAIPGLERLCFERPEVFGSHAIAATDAMLHYFQLRGNRRIAFVGPDTPADPILQKKLSAYACYTSRRKLQNLCGLVTKSAASMDQLAEEWSSFRGDLAVVAYDDEHAVRLITAMHKLGLRAPADYRIVGFNNTGASRYSDPPLSTVCQNFGYIGRSLVRSARALAASETWQSEETPRTRLVLRETCGGSAVDDNFRAALPQIDFVSEHEAF